MTDTDIYADVANVATDVLREAELASAGLRWARRGPDGVRQVPVGTPEHVASCRRHLDALLELRRAM